MNELQRRTRFRRASSPLPRMLGGGLGLSALQAAAGNRAVAKLLRRDGDRTIPAAVAAAVERTGAPLAPWIRERAERRHGVDLGAVRVRTDPAAAESVGARALTAGAQIVLGAGESAHDEQLMSHELAHVVQQSTGRAAALTGLGGDAAARSALEAEASSGAAIASGAGTAHTAGLGALQLQELGELGGPTIGGLKLLGSKAPAETKEVEDWVPRDVLADVYAQKYAPGAYLLPYVWPAGFQGALILSVGDRSPPHQIVRFYRLYPDDFEFYFAYTNGDEHAARVIQEKYIQRNRDMWHYVKDLGYPPEYAEAELDYIDVQIFKALIEAAAGVLASGAAISTIGGSIARQGATTAGRLQPGEYMEQLQKTYGKQLEEEAEQVGSAASKSSAAAGPPSPGPVLVPPPTLKQPPPPGLWERIKERVSRFFYKPTTTWDPNLPPDIQGQTTKYGDVQISTAVSGKSMWRVMKHEGGHSWLRPKFLPFGRTFRANVAQDLYDNVQFMRWLEEAVVEVIARVKIYGASSRSIVGGLRFAFQRQHYQLVASTVAVQGAALVVTIGGVAYSIYVTTTDQLQELLDRLLGAASEQEAAPTAD